jgi:hypothetical protein
MRAAFAKAAIWRKTTSSFSSVQFVFSTGEAFFDADVQSAPFQVHPGLPQGTEHGPHTEHANGSVYPKSFVSHIYSRQSLSQLRDGSSASITGTKFLTTFSFDDSPTVC